MFYQNSKFLIISILIVLVPLVGSAFGQTEVQPFEYCEPGHECSCNERSGVWTDHTTGFRINTGCDSDDYN